MAQPLEIAKSLLAILDRDEDRLKNIDDYLHGKHAGPYLPETAGAEYRLLARRAVSNWMPLLVGTPAQALYVDGFRRGGGDAGATRQPGDSPEWVRWQRSRMDARQAAVHRAALAYGHSFVLVTGRGDKVQISGLSSLRTAALYVDPANDEVPYAALTVDRWSTTSGGERVDGAARLWIGRMEFPVKLTKDGPRVGRGSAHGATETPVTRFAAAVDLEGRTIGVIEPMIPLQDRINQSVFDLLVAQTYGSFKVRWATGMAPPIKLHPDLVKNPETGAMEANPRAGDPIIDPTTGQPELLPIDTNASRMMFGEDPETRFGTLDETPLEGYIASIDMSIRNLAAVSQTPPHYLLGQLANLSAEALTAAETALSRKTEEFRKGFGESWERVFRLAAELAGDLTAGENFAGEIVWRDMEQRSLAQSADALGKLAVQLGIPARGLWARVPGTSQVELDEWNALYREDNAEGELARALRPATAARDAVAPAEDGLAAA